MSKPLIIITNKMEPISMDADEFTKIIEKAYEYGVEDGVLKARTETVPILPKIRDFESGFQTIDCTTPLKRELNQCKQFSTT